MRIQHSLLLVILAFTLSVSFLLKKPCLLQSWTSPANIQFSQACYNDIQPLYKLRGFDRGAIPYIEQRVFEYPPLMALQFWGASFFAKSNKEFFKANAIVLSLLALLTLVALVGAVGARQRVLWFAAAPPLLTYAFYNLDLLAVAALACAMWAWRFRKNALTGALLGIGAAAKLFPAFVLPALLLRRPQASARLIAGFLMTWLTFNLPFLAGDWVVNGDVSGWLEMFRFHARRLPDYGSLWAWLGTPTKSHKLFVDRASFLFFCSGVASLLWLQHKRQKRAERIDIWAYAGAAIAWFLLVNKVHSPQYALWLLPFFVVARTPSSLVVMYFVADALVFRISMWWMAETPAMGASQFRGPYLYAVIFRAAVLMALIASYAQTIRFNVIFSWMPRLVSRSGLLVRK